MTSQTPMCWFCDREQAVEAREYRVELYGNVAPGAPGQLTYETTTVTIPRCAACARAHSRELLLAVLGFLAGGVLGVLLYGAISEWIARVTGWSVFVGVLFLGFGVAGGAIGLVVTSSLTERLLGARRSGMKSDEHPSVRQLLDGGWKQGSKPPKGAVPSRK